MLRVRFNMQRLSPLFTVAGRRRVCGVRAGPALLQQVSTGTGNVFTGSRTGSRYAYDLASCRSFRFGSSVGARSVSRQCADRGAFRPKLTGTSCEIRRSPAIVTRSIQPQVFYTRA